MKEQILKTNPQAETPAEVKEISCGEKERPYGKFASAEALLQAYENLEREFTKKSQRLKQSEESGSKELQKQRELAAFFEKHPLAKRMEQELLPVLQESDAPDAEYLQFLEQKFRFAEDYKADAGFLEEHIYRDPDIQARIIHTYLEEIAAGRPPRILPAGQSALTPPTRPRSVAEAGKLAEKLMEERRMQ